MPSYKARGIVLRRTRLGETDMIITILADDGHQIRAVAKGVRKPTSKFGGRLEPGSMVDLLLHTGKNLDVIAEAASVRQYPGLRSDLDRQAAAAVVEDVLDSVTRDAESDARIFGLAEATLDALETASAQLALVAVVAFLLKAMAMHGYRPELASCVNCGAALATSEHFSLAAGGAVCEGCGSYAAGLERLSPAGRAWLERLLMARMSDLDTLEIPSAAAIDCFDLVRAFVSYHLPTRLRALDYYARMTHEEARRGRGNSEPSEDAGPA